MSWGDNSGQIIGLKKRERELEGRRVDADRGIQLIANTLRRHTNDDSEGLTRVIVWAAEQLDRLLHGLEVTPLPRKPRIGGSKKP
jgi:hypothetical protein